MNPALSIDPTDGSVRIDGCAVVIHAGLSSEEALADMSSFYCGTTDHKNGYVWMRFNGITLGGQPCELSICFYMNKLIELNWAVSLPTSRKNAGVPTRGAVDAEIHFVINTLSSMLSSIFWSGKKRFKWGEVWSTFDAREFAASSGLRYTPRSI